MSKYLSLAVLLLLLIVPALAQDADTLTIAFIGSENAADQVLFRAAQLAANEINAETGDDELRDAEDNAYELAIRFYEASNESETLDAYQDAVDDDAIAVLMSTDGDNLDALVDDASISIPVFHAVADGTSGNSFYRLVADYASQADDIADYLVNERHFSQIAVAAADSSSAQDAQDAFVTAVEADGGEIVIDSSHSADADDLQSDAEDIRESGAEALLLWTLDSQAVELLEALQNEGWDGLIVYNNLSPNFIERAGSLAEGLYSPATWTALAYDSQSQAFSHDFAAQYNAQPSSAAAAYYDAVYLLAEAVRQGGENAASELSTLGEYDGVQALYNNAQAEDLLLVQYWGGSVLEAARYTAGVCVNCLDTWRAETDAEDVSSRDSLLIALIIPTNGPAEALGNALENAVDLAVSEINDAGGLLTSDTIQYTLVVQSYSANNSQEAAAALQAAKDDGAVVVMGLDFNAQVLDNLAIVGQIALPQFVSATDARIPVLERSNSALQIRSNDAAIADAVVSYLVNERELEGISTVAARTDYAREAQAAAEDAIAASDEGRLEVSLNYDLGETDFSALATQIVDSASEAVLVWSPPADASALLAALESAGYEGVFVYPYLTGENLGSFQSENIEVLAASNWWASASDWASVSFSAAYSDNYGDAPLPQAVSYYDAVYWLAAGIESVGSDSTALNNYLLDTESFVGVQGEYLPATYGDGETIRSVFIGTVDGETLVETARYNGETCLFGCD
jgi:branched-chain amino acid transport system substrate-binding protein